MDPLAEFAPDMMVSVYGFRDTAQADGNAAASDGVQDLHTFPPTTISDAVPLYHAGHTIICWRMLDQLPEALQRSAEILAAIGMPHQPVAARGLQEPWNKARLLVISLVYTKSGNSSGLEIHFDRFDSVVVQLRGQKRWRVGSHQCLEYPIYNEESAERVDFPPSLPRLATRSQYVEELEEIEMRRGSVLFLPRGTYHTADGEASFSIGYHFALPTWSDVVLAALERRLTQDPFMRKTPFGAFSLEEPSAEARELMAQAAGRAQEVLNDPRHLLEADLLGNLASHHQAVFRLAPGAVARLVPGDPPVIENYGGRGIGRPAPRRSRPVVPLDEREQMSPRAVWNLCASGGNGSS